jgi:hypothetical protein
VALRILARVVSRHHKQVAFSGAPPGVTMTKAKTLQNATLNGATFSIGIPAPMRPKNLDAAL